MNFIYLILIFSIITACNSQPSNKGADPWNNAKWIAYEKLPDSMKVVPAVHGKGNRLGEKCTKPAVIPIFRKEFRTEGEIVSANMKICGLGHYLLYINDEKAGNRFLSPGWSYYRKRYLFNSFDVTNMINKGENVIGIKVGPGFYYISRQRYRKLVVAHGYPKLLFDLKIQYKDGHIFHFVSDENCRVYPSATTFSSIYGGEDYDARLEQEGWKMPGFDDSNWKIPVLIEDGGQKLEPETDHPLIIIRKFTAENIILSETNRKVYDFGQNASGIVHFRVKGSRGAEVVIRPAELIDAKGNITQRSSGYPYELHYILKGGGIEEWQPAFTYYGFRYADIEVIEPQDAVLPTEILDVKMLHTRNSAPVAGNFECSDTLFNQIFELINWGIKSNMASVATDCPHREKLGWLEQTYLIGPSMHYNFNIHSFYRKIVGDMMDSQLESGLVPDIAPEYVPFNKGFRDSPEWGSASIIIPWQLYRWYGDKDLLRKAYPMMIRYMEYLMGKSEDYILDYGLGDWYDLGPEPPGVAQLTPVSLTATSIFYYDLVLVSRIADLLGFTEKAEKYLKISENVKTAFLEKFFMPLTGLCSTGSQTAYAMPLYTGMIPEKYEELVFQNLIDSISNNDYALTAGDIGYHFLVRTLSERGRSDILYKMNNRTDRPGYGYQILQGATSLTESWKALPTLSNNHMMLGHLMEWFYNGLGGIYQTRNSIAYSEIMLAPKPVGKITWVNCSFNSPKGMIYSEWKTNGNIFTWNFEIPAKCMAGLLIPDGYGREVRLYDVSRNRVVKPEIRHGLIKVGNGKYRLTARRNS